MHDVDIAQQWYVGNFPPSLSFSLLLLAVDLKTK